MPENNAPPPNEEQKRILSQSMGVFLDVMVQVVALQFALVDAGVLTFAQVQEHIQRLNSIPSLLQARSMYGVRSDVIEGLLASYKGPVQ